MGAIEIIVTPAGPGNCYAHFRGHENHSSAGAEPAAAIGNLIRNHGNLVGITIDEAGNVHSASQGRLIPVTVPAHAQTNVRHRGEEHDLTLG